MYQIPYSKILESGQLNFLENVKLFSFSCFFWETEKLIFSEVLSEFFTNKFYSFFYYKNI